MSLQDDIRSAIIGILPEVSCVLGWGPGPDALQNAPLLIRSPDEAAGFRADYLSVNNLALFLPEHKGRKIGVVLKGCDSRSVGQLLAEELIKREDMHIIGYPCFGVIDVAKVMARLPGREQAEATALEDRGDEVIVTFPDGKVSLSKDEVTADKCLRCEYPNALYADTFVGEPRQPVVETDSYADLAAFEALPLDERLAFWEKEMSRCIRCYACRNACPMCVCRDHCIASSREPEWVSQADGVREKMFFQIIHASHLAGRCTGCGECQRACPVGIPVLLLKRSLNRSVEQLFNYRAGVDIEGTPPLLTFQIEENKIKEREW